MRVLIVDSRYMDKSDKRVEEIIEILSSEISERNITTIKKPDDLLEHDPCDYDFVMFHFPNEGKTSGENAFAFLDGLKGQSATRNIPQTALKYRELGERIKATGKKPDLFIYSGAQIPSEAQKRIKELWSNVCIRNSIGTSSLAGAFNRDLKHSLVGGRIDLKRLCPIPLEYLPILAILCQAYLIAHYEICRREKKKLPAEVIRALEQMGWTDAELRKEPVLSIIRINIDRESESIHKPNWWFEPLGWGGTKKKPAQNKLKNFRKKINEECMNLGNKEVPETISLFLNAIFSESGEDISVAVANAYCFIAQALGAKPCKP